MEKETAEKITGKDIKLILWSIIAGAILSPVVLSIFKLLLESPTTIGYVLRKAAYNNASNLHENSGNTITFIVYLLLTTLFIFGLRVAFRDSKKATKDFENYKKQYDEIVEKTPKQIQDFNYQESRWKSDKSQYKQILPLMIMVQLFFLGLAFINTRANKLYSQFIKESETIAPYISEQDVKLLKSRWRLMKQEEDHNKIVHYIDSTYAANNLPKPDRD